VTLLDYRHRPGSCRPRRAAPGVYTFSPVRIGHYHVTVADKGFADDHADQHYFDCQPDPGMWMFRLKPGAYNRTVYGDHGATVLQTDEASVGQPSAPGGQ